MQRWFLEKKELLLNDLFSFLKFKSISANLVYKEEVLACAFWLRDYLGKIGMESQLVEMGEYPTVFAQTKNPDKTQPTILIYGHYDVQPVDPLDLWRSDPFDPKVVNNQIYARGALDDKGQIFCAIAAIYYFLDQGEKLPFNVKFCIEGEEESGSVGLINNIAKHRDLFSADYLLAIDFEMLDRDVPSITLGARGLVCLSIEIIGSDTDLHSGAFGGVAYNPLRAAVELFAKIWDKEGRIAIEGFYDDIVKTDKLSLVLDEQKYLKELGLTAFHHEKGFSQLESNWLRPTIEINGLAGGYFQPGFKTVIPSKVICKLSARLVEGQDPEKIVKLIVKFLQDHLKKGMLLNIEVLSKGLAIKGGEESLFTKALGFSMENVFGKKPIYIYCGGSVAAIAALVQTLKSEPTMVGFGIATDNVHAPNEHFSLDRLELGFLSLAKSFKYFGKLLKQ